MKSPEKHTHTSFAGLFQLKEKQKSFEKVSKIEAGFGCLVIVVMDFAVTQCCYVKQSKVIKIHKQLEVRAVPEEGSRVPDLLSTKFMF